MKKEVADLWVNALRSGKYKQVQGSLCKYNSFCCLGVLCEIALENNVPIKITTEDDNKVYDGHSIYLPKIVQDWAGLKNHMGRVNGSCLADMNDYGYTFEYIAQTIEENYEKI